MISWKDSFEKINNELDLARKKQNALEELHGNGKISQLTYENLNKALTMEIEQIEARRKELAEKMTSKLNELEQQISTLETFLANVEMSHAAGEITDELHNQEVSALNFGLEATKNEFDFIKEAIIQLVPDETQAELATAIETAETVEATPTETAMETMPEVSDADPIETLVETPPVIDETSVEQPAEIMEETSETAEVTEIPVETSTEEMTEEMAEEIAEETVPEEQVLPDTPIEEGISEEEVLSEEIASETPTEEILTEDPVFSETPMEEGQPFREEDQEE